MASTNLFMYPIDQTDMSLLLICAFRYALGRSTYVPQAVMDLIEANLNVFTPADIDNIVREIDAYPHRSPLALADSWFFFRNKLLTYKENQTKLNAEAGSPSGDNHPE